MSGRFISTEGIDGTGKTTMCNILANRMKEEGYDIVLTKEPGSPLDTSNLGQEIRQILFHTVTTHKMARGVADCLLLADHIQHVEKVVKPALAEGKTVISDRYADSQFSYAVAKNSPGFIMEAYSSAFGPIPDLTLLMITDDVRVMLDRARARRGETHQEGKTWNDEAMQRNIQNEYLKNLVGQDRTVVIKVEVDKGPDQIFNELVWPAVKFYLENERILSGAI